LNPNRNLPNGATLAEIVRSAGQDCDQICSEPNCFEPIVDDWADSQFGLCEEHLRAVKEGLPE